MRALAALALLSSFGWWGMFVQKEPRAPAPAPVDFRRDIQPIFESRCMPCHFPGGKMHGQLPFDDPKTIRHLGSAVLTRIKDPREKLLIETFLAQKADAKKAG